MLCCVLAFFPRPTPSEPLPRAQLSVPRAHPPRRPEAPPCQPAWPRPKLDRLWRPTPPPRATLTIPNPSTPCSPNSSTCRRRLTPPDGAARPCRAGRHHGRGVARRRRDWHETGEQGMFVSEGGYNSFLWKSRAVQPNGFWFSHGPHITTVFL